MESNLKIEFKKEDDGVLVVSFDGEFDKSGFMSVRDELNAVVKEFSGKFLIFNFVKLKYINSEGIGYLMEIHSYFSTKDGKFSIISERSNVNDIFDAIGLSEIVSVYNDMEEFYNSFKK